MRAPTLRELRVEAGRRGLGTTVLCDRLRWGWEYTIRSSDGSIPVRCRAPTKTGARTGAMAALRTVPRTKEGQMSAAMASIRRERGSVW